MPTAYPGALDAPKRGWRGLSALLAGLLTALLVVTGVNAAPAMAAPTGTVQLEFPIGADLDENGVPVLVPGKPVKLRISYDQQTVAGGHVAVIDVPAGLTVEEQLVENDAIESFVIKDGKITVTFKDPYAASNGWVDLDVQVNTVDLSKVVDVVWNVNGGEASTTKVIVKKPDDKFIDFTKDSAQKTTSDPNFEIKVDESGNLIIDRNALLAKEFHYAITVKSINERSVMIEDVLGKGLALVDNSFSLDRTVWGANGMNQDGPDAVPGLSVQTTETGFSYELQAEANSLYTLKYRAKIADEAALDAIIADLQTAYNAVKDVEGETFSVALTNTATIAGAESTATVTLNGRVPKEEGPNEGAAFGKWSSLSKSDPYDYPVVELEADGQTLVKPVAVQFTIQADLTQFKKHENSTRYKLNRNVVITDELPANYKWGTGDFIKPDTAIENFREVSGVSEADFASDDYVGAYMVVGQKLMINAGKDVTKRHVYRIQAELVSVAGITGSTESGNPYAALQFSNLKNTAKFEYKDGDAATAESNDTVITLKTPGEEEITDNRAFEKKAGKEPIVIDKPGVVQVPFTFTVAGKNAGLSSTGDAAKSKIIDYIDHDALDVTPKTLDAIKKSITGTYANGDKNVKLTGDAFELTINKDGNLEFVPTSGAAWGVGAGDPLPGKFSFTASIPSQPVHGYNTLNITNSASYSGADREVVHVTGTSTSASVNGSEIKFEKAVYVPSAEAGKPGTFKTSVRADLVETEAGVELKQKEYIYRVRMQPKLKYTEMLRTVTDALDSQVKFIGFVSPENLESGQVSDGNEIKFGSKGLKAIYDEASRTISVAAKQPIAGGENSDLFFKVSIEKFTEGVPVLNNFAGSIATITPTDKLPIDVSKLNSKNPNGPLITDIVDGNVRPDSSQFELRDDAGKVVYKNLYLVDGKLRVAGSDDKAGQHLTPTVEKAGTYTLHEIYAPQGYILNTEPVEIKVSEDGSSVATEFFNDPITKDTGVEVGNYVWFDADGDGIQGTSPEERPIPGVKLVLTDEKGKPVIGLNGRVVEPTRTNDEGEYYFKNLPVLQDGQKYVVSIDREDQKTKDALGDWLVTKTKAGSDPEKDSSEWVAETIVPLTENGAKDYSLDFGFKPRSVSVGDYVWLDTNRDGVQDENEAGIPGVVLELVGPDGEPVTNVFGKPVGTVTTDKNGHYTFENLPVLNSGETYTVKIVQGDESTVKALDGLIPTKEKGTEDREKDSSTWAAVSRDDLVNDGDRDPSLDFGFHTKMVSVGDYVWLDENRDGIQDDGEPGIKGVKLVLVGPDGKPVTDVFGKPVEPVVTDGKGFYEFVNLPALKEGEKYTVAIDREDEGTKEALKGLTPTKIEGTEDEEKDSSTWTAENRIDLVNDGTHDPSLDFGFQKKSYAVGDYVWIDANNDGLQGDDELPLAGVTVKLLDEKGEVLLETLTNAEGRYIFDELAAGTYQVQFELTKEQAKKYQFTDQDGGDTGLDSDADDKGLSKQFTLDDSTALVLDGDYTFASVKATEGIDPTWDAGVIVKKVSVGDYVWLDKNRDGVQDENEAGIPGVVLELVGPDGKPVTDVFGNPVGTVTTDEKGHYSFDNLPALVKGETYTVKIVQDHESTVKALEGLVPTKEEGTKDSEKDSSTWTAESRDDLVSDGDRDPSLDFGFQHKSYAIGDVVWIDTDRDGLQGKDEAPLAGVTVYLLDENGDRITDANGDEVLRVTDDNGRYLFDELRAGTYGVEFVLTEAQAKQYQFTIQGGDAARDSDADPKTGKSAAIVLNDTNAALMSGKEYGIGTVKATQGIDPTWDAGVIVKSVSVGNYVWLDQDRNGVQNDGEQGIEGVKLVLLDPQGNVVTTDKDGNPFTNDRTDKDGHYSFTNLPALSKGETYTVRIDREDEGTKAALFGKLPTVEKGTEDREKDSSTWTAVSRDDLVNDGEEDLSLDFGFYSEKVTVGDYVWLDKNRDGIQDEGETPIPGVKLEILGPDGKPVTDIFGEPVAPVVTDENGEYLFENLPVLKPGEKYTVKIDREDEGTKEALKGLTPTKEKGTKDESKDSSTWTAESGNLVKDGDKDLTLDFGFQEKSYAVGDVVWIDTNKDGLQDDTEYTLADVKVRLFEEVVNENGEVEAVLVGETTTNKQGLYVFDELPAGKYRVQFELTPAQAKIYKFTKYAAGKTALDSNAGENGFSEWFILDDTNEALVTDYEYSNYVGGIKATQGIDPTWDAGVIVLNTPTPGPGPEPVDPTEPGTPEHPKGGTTIGGLANTGGMELWGYFAGGAALLLLGAGALLVSGRRREARHG